MSGPKQRRARLGRLLRLRQQELLQIEQQLGQSQQELRREQARVDRTTQELDDVLRAPVAPPPTNQAAAFESSLRYAAHLRAKIAAQQSTVLAVRARWRQLQRSYTQLKAKASSMELLLQHHAENFRTFRLRSEQKQMDDRVLSKRHSDYA